MGELAINAGTRVAALPRSGRTRMTAKGLLVRIFAAVCVLIFMTAGAWLLRAYFTPESYIYLDIAPSVRLDVNRFGRVISVVPLNSDADALLMICPVKKAKADECVRSVVDHCKYEGYINENNYDVDIKIMSSSERLKNGIGAIVAQLEKDNLAVTVTDASVKDGEKTTSTNQSPLLN